MILRHGFSWTIALTLATGCTGDDGGTSDGTSGTDGTDTDTTTGSTDSAGSTSGATDSGSTGGGTTDTTGGSTGGSTGGASGGLRILYRDAPADDADRRLWAVDVIDGSVGTPEPITGPYTGDEILSPLGRTSPDARWRTFEISSQANGTRDLYVVEINAPTVGTPVMVSGAPVPEPGIATSLVFSPDSQLLAFRAGADNSGGADIYLVPLDGTEPGATVRLNPDTSPTDGVGDAEFSDDSTRIAYAGSFDDGIENVYVQDADPANPGTPTQISTNTDAAVSVGSPRWYLDDAWLGYSSDVDGDSIAERFFVDMNGAPGTPIELDPADTLTVRGPGMAPDMRGYVYWHGDGTAGDLYFAAFDGSSFGAPVLLNTIGGGSDVFAKDFFWSSDADWVFYMAEHDTAGVRELYAVDMSGASPAQPVKVNGSLLTDTDVSTPRLSPGSSHIYYFAAQETMNMEIFRVALSPGSLGGNERVHAQTIHGSTELIFHDDTQALFTGNLDGGDVQELWLADLSVTPPTTVMASAPTADGASFGARFSRDGRHVVYDGGTPENPVFLVDLDGAGPGTATEVVPVTDSGVDAIISLP